jgi:hypothetical protein
MNHTLQPFPDPIAKSVTANKLPNVLITMVSECSQLEPMAKNYPKRLAKVLTSCANQKPSAARCSSTTLSSTASDKPTPAYLNAQRTSFSSHIWAVVILWARITCLIQSARIASFRHMLSSSRHHQTRSDGLEGVVISCVQDSTTTLSLTKQELS